MHLDLRLNKEQQLILYVNGVSRIIATNATKESLAEEVIEYEDYLESGKRADKSTRWSPSFTSRTRVLPTAAWALTTAKKNAMRALKRKFPKYNDQVLVLVKMFAALLAVI